MSMQAAIAEARDLLLSALAWHGAESAEYAKAREDAAAILREALWREQQDEGAERGDEERTEPGS